MYGLLTKLLRSRWLDIGRVLFFFACLWTETESRSINTQKKNSVEVHKHAKKERGTRRVVPSGQDGSILPAWVANHSAGFDSLAERAIIIIIKHYVRQVLSQIVDSQDINIFFNYQTNGAEPIQTMICR